MHEGHVLNVITSLGGDKRGSQGRSLSRGNLHERCNQLIWAQRGKKPTTAVSRKAERLQRVACHQRRLERKGEGGDRQTNSLARAGRDPVRAPPPPLQDLWVAAKLAV